MSSGEQTADVCFSFCAGKAMGPSEPAAYRPSLSQVMQSGEGTCNSNAPTHEDGSDVGSKGSTACAEQGIALEMNQSFSVAAILDPKSNTIVVDPRADLKDLKDPHLMLPLPGKEGREEAVPIQGFAVTPPFQVIPFSPSSPSPWIHFGLMDEGMRKAAVQALKNILAVGGLSAVSNPCVKAALSALMGWEGITHMGGKLFRRAEYEGQKNLEPGTLYLVFGDVSKMSGDIQTLLGERGHVSLKEFGDDSENKLKDEQKGVILQAIRQSIGYANIVTVCRGGKSRSPLLSCILRHLTGKEVKPECRPEEPTHFYNQILDALLRTDSPMNLEDALSVEPRKRRGEKRGRE